MSEAEALARTDPPATDEPVRERRAAGVVAEPGPGASVGEVVRGAIAASVARLLDHEPGVRLGEDPEEIHQARVATRRLRSDLRTFRAFLHPAWARELRGELAWLGADLGAVRDAEVLLDRLRDRAVELGAADEGGTEPLLRGLVRRREEARHRLLSSMDGDRYPALVDRLVRAADTPALAAEGSVRATEEILSPLMARPWWRLREAASGLGPASLDEDLHAARIRAKRVRYAAEAVAPVFGKPARAFSKNAARLQDVLGEHQDSVVARAWLRDAAIRSGAREAFVAGRLTELERAAGSVARAAWPEAWRRLSRKRLRFWA